MKRTSWIWFTAAAVVAAASIGAGDALAKKGGGGGGGGGTPATPDIAFLKYESRTGQTLWTMKADGTSQASVTPATPWRASWSPDGTQLAFWGNGFGSGEGPGVYVMDADGTDLRRVTNHTLTTFMTVAWCPKSAPDGTQWLAFTEQVTYSDGATGYDVYLVSLDGMQRFSVTSQFEASNGRISEIVCDWSPDGTRLLYWAGGSVDGYRVMEISYDTNGDIVLPATFVDITSTKSGGGPYAQWARTGDQLVFSAIENGLGDVFVIDFSDLNEIGAAVNITNTPTIEEKGPTWSPDDSEILCSIPVKLVAYNVQTGASRTVASFSAKGSTAVGWPTWKPSSQ